jgi:hypothetical protein
MLGLDHNAAYLLWALGITVAGLGTYGLYLRSRLMALRTRVLRQAQDERVRQAQDERARQAQGEPVTYSARNVTAAAPMVTTAHAASSANGPSTP